MYKSHTGWRICIQSTVYKELLKLDSKEKKLTQFFKEGKNSEQPTSFVQRKYMSFK